MEAWTKGRDGLGRRMVHLTASVLLVLLVPAAVLTKDYYSMAGDTRTRAPNLIYRGPWGVGVGGATALYRGNVEVVVGHAEALAYRNLGDVAGYLEVNLDYKSKEGEPYQERAGAAARVDVKLVRLSERFKLGLAAIATEFHDKLLLVDYRSTGGGGLWLDVESEYLSNGFSVFGTVEHELFMGHPSETAGRLSLRNITLLTLTGTSRFIADVYYVPAFSDLGGDYRFSAEGTLEVDIVPQVLSLTMSSTYEYDSLPKPEVKSYDFQLLGGLKLRLSGRSRR